VYDVDKFGNRINITVELQEYRCKVCGKRFFGRLPSCVEDGSNISKDLAEGMVDDFLDTTTLAGSPAAPAIAAKYGVSAKTFSDALGKRIAKAKTRIRSLQPCSIFAIYPFDYGQHRCCALWGYKNDNERPILYDIQWGYEAALVEAFLTKHPFQFREPPVNAYADLSPDVLLAISRVLYPQDYEQCVKRAEFDRRHMSKEDLVDVYCASAVGVLRMLLRDNVLRFQEQNNSNLGKLRKPFEERLNELVVRVTDDYFGADSFDTFLALWNEHAAADDTQKLIKPLYEDLHKAAPACKVGLSIATKVCDVTPFMEFINTFYSKQYTFEEMCYVVLNCNATRNNQKIRFQTLMQSGYDPSPAGDVYSFYTDLEELNTQFSE
jgi:hypothetical protein